MHQQALRACRGKPEGCAFTAGSGRVSILPGRRHLIRLALAHAAVPQHAHPIVRPEGAVAVQIHLEVSAT